MAPHRAAWADLAARALEPTIFSDPGFLLPAALHLGGRRPRFLLAWDCDAPGRLLGLCCVASQGPGLPLTAWLHPQATSAFPLLDAERAAEALADLLAQAAGRLRPAGLLMHGLPMQGPTRRVMDAQPWAAETVGQRGRAVLRERPPPLAGKAGKEFRRQARRLAEQGSVALAAAVAAPEAFEAFLTLEARGWKGRGATALAASPHRARFARAMAAALAAEGRCTVHSLTLDGRPLAMGVVLRSGPHAFFWKTAYDEAYARFSPGAHLAAAIGATVVRDPGLRLIDSCAIPDHSMIDRLWPGRMLVCDMFLTPRPALSAWQRLTLRIERGRRMLRLRAKRAAAAMASVRRARRRNPDMARS